MEEWEIESLMGRFYSSLKEVNKRDYLMLFSDLQIQIEGWFRGELMNFLKNNNIDITVKNRESRINNCTHKKADFKLEFTDEIYWIELKHLLVGYQLDNLFPLKFYFYKNTYIYNDIKKLQEVAHSDKKQYLYSLAFISTNYPYNKTESSNDNKIASKQDLKDKYCSVIKSKNEIKDKVSLESLDYDETLRFGYLLIKINCPKIL